VLDGYGLTRAIRQQEGNDRPLPIVALTANALRGEAEHIMACGIDVYLTKPIRLAALQSVLKKWLPCKAAPVPALWRKAHDHSGSEPLRVLRRLFGVSHAAMGNAAVCR
jgi:DNA-binding response OmpR family regulator